MSNDFTPNSNPDTWSHPMPPDPTPTPEPVVPPKTSKIDLWCEAIKQMESAKPYRNNPGNLRYVGQRYAIPDNGFCKFDTYDHGYDALKNMLMNACTGKSHIYNPGMTLYEFYCTYAPYSDGNNPREYSSFVAKHIGVSTDTIISSLIL